jgi:hypothetical protein
MLKAKAKLKTKKNQTTINKFKNFNKLAQKKPAIKFGFLENSKYPYSGIPVSNVAFLNEYGTKNIPSRPFLRTTLIDNKKKYEKMLKKNVKNSISRNFNLIKGLEKIGKVTVSDIKKTITDFKTPPNKESTINKKKTSNPLINTGLLRSSVSYKIINSKKRSKR